MNYSMSFQSMSFHDLIYNSSKTPYVAIDERG